ncbi:MAG: TRAP transporter small permease [Pseudomonadota bacterium]
MEQVRQEGASFDAIMSRFSDGVGVVGAIILVLMLLLIALSVVLRYAFNAPITWADQVATYGLVYMTFIGAPRVLARRGHVSVDILEASLNPHRQKLLRVFVDVVGMLYCVAFCYLALRELNRVVTRGAEFSDAFTVPQWIVYWVIPFGAAMLALQFLANLLIDLRRLRNSNPANGTELGGNA